MTSRTVWVLVVALVACGNDTPSNRERVLGMIPPAATVIVAVEGRTLSHPRIRSIVEVVRHDLPDSMDCVLEAALAGGELAIGFGSGVTVALAARNVPHCPVLSKVADGLYVATLGGASVTGESAIASDELARARPYLMKAPIAVFVAARQLRVLATAQAEPLAAWAAFDAVDIDPAVVEKLIRAYVERLASSPEIAPFATELRVDRKGSQVVVALDGRGPDADLALAVKTALAQHRAATALATPVFPCPAITAPITACVKEACGNPAGCSPERLVLHASPHALAMTRLLAARFEPVVARAGVDGMKLRDDVAALGLRAGDILRAVDGRRVTAADQLAQFLRGSTGSTQLEVTRMRRAGSITIEEKR